MGTCLKHSVKYPLLGTCPRCSAEELAERQKDHFTRMEGAAAQVLREQLNSRMRHHEIIQLLEEESFKKRNPGEFECPECLFITLKRGATRCPICHSMITQDYWVAAYEAERQENERRAIEEQRQREKSELMAKVSAQRAEEYGRLIEQDRINENIERRRRQVRQWWHVLVALLVYAAYVWLSLVFSRS